MITRWKWWENIVRSIFGPIFVIAKTVGLIYINLLKLQNQVVILKKIKTSMSFKKNVTRHHSFYSRISLCLPNNLMFRQDKKYTDKTLKHSKVDIAIAIIVFFNMLPFSHICRKETTSSRKLLYSSFFI